METHEVPVSLASTTGAQYGTLCSRCTQNFSASTHRTEAFNWILSSHAASILSAAEAKFGLSRWHSCLLKVLLIFPFVALAIVREEMKETMRWSRLRTAYENIFMQFVSFVYNLPVNYDSPKDLQDKPITFYPTCRTRVVPSICTLYSKEKSFAPTRN
jgi:hypothetical protein